MDELRWRNLNDELKKVRTQKMDAVKEQNFVKACEFRDKELEILEMLGTPEHGLTSNRLSEEMLEEQRKRAEEWEAYTRRFK